MHFGAALRLMRADAGLSLTALARRLGVSPAYLSRVEHGHDAPPAPDRVVAIARALEVPPLVLLELAQGAGAAIASYLERVPEASALFVEIARRDLGPAEIARLKAHLDRELPAPTPSRRPRLAELVGDRILLGVSCDDLDDVIGLAATRLAVPGLDARTLAARIAERERDAPSALGSGVVVPHVSLRGAPPAAALLLLARPLRTVTPDGRPVRVAVIVVGPRGRRHLETLAHVARLAARGLADQLAAERSPAGVRARLEALDLA